jgi:D-proline reductase (dithiol) PrdB
VGLVARQVEERGICTVCIMNLRKVAERILAPRTLLVDRPFGALLGQPGDRAGQEALVLAALAMLEDPTVKPGEIREYRSQ